MSFIDDFERHELYLARLATQLLNAHIYPSLTEAYKAARLILLDAEAINSPAQLNKITAAIRKATNETIAKSWEDATAELEQIAIYEAGYYAALVGGYQDARLKTPADKQIAGYVARALMSLTSGDRVQSGVWSDYVGAQIASVGNAYDSSVKAGFANGETVSQIAGRLRITTDGLLTREAEALARTGVQHYANRAREAMAEANADVIEFRVYWATMDNRTTTLCAGRHLKKWKMDDNKFPDIPAHYNCRSSWVFTVYGQDGKVDGPRAAIGGNKGEDAAEAFERRQDRTDKKIKYRGKKDKSIFNPGQIAANTKYDDWLRKQPAWFQDSALGATRAKLFREGGMSIGKFNDMAGRPLTLAQLRELDAEAFKRAGL